MDKKYLKYKKKYLGGAREEGGGAAEGLDPDLTRALAESAITARDEERRRVENTFTLYVPGVYDFIQTKSFGQVNLLLRNIKEKIFAAGYNTIYTHMFDRMGPGAVGDRGIGIITDQYIREESRIHTENLIVHNEYLTLDMLRPFNDRHDL